MARPLKQGIGYFSLDVDFFSDLKIRRLLKACGPASTSILIGLLCCIYRDKGYYIVWDSDLSFLVADTVGTTEGAVEEVIRKALQVGFFHKGLYEKYKILTSDSIQKRFKAAVTRRGEIEYIPGYWVSDCKNEVIAYNNSVFACNNPVFDDKSTQSKVKRKKSNTISLPSFEAGEGDGSVKTVKAMETMTIPFELMDQETGRTLAPEAGREPSVLSDRQFAQDIYCSEHFSAVPAEEGQDVSSLNMVTVSHHPPKGGGSPVSKARRLFEDYFRESFSEEYYWTAKDAFAMKQLLRKLEFQRRQREMSTDEDSLLHAFRVFLSSIHDEWIIGNFSLAIVNSKFNEIILQARNGKITSNHRPAYPSAAERIREESARHVQGIAARLGGCATLPDAGEPDVF